MNDADFQDRLAGIRALAYIEDYGQALSGLFTGCDPAQRDEIRKAIRSGALNGPKAWKNPTDYERSDLTREQHIRSRLMAVAIYGLSADYREDLMTLGYIYNGARVLGLDADALLEHAADLSEATAAKFLRDFARRPADGKSLRAWGLRAIQTSNGPWIEWIP